MAYPEAEARVRRDVSDLLARGECVYLYERVQLPESDAVKGIHASFELEPVARTAAPPELAREPTNFRELILYRIVAPVE